MSVTAVPGFEAGGIASGIKASGRPDLALVATADRVPVAAAGVFTTNLACAAPVQVSRSHLHDGRAAAVVLNSGNANAATGEAGRAVARRMCELTAERLGCAVHDVLVCSTGLIGIPLGLDPIERGLPELAVRLRADRPGGQAAADAILTTDTVRKEALVSIALPGGPTLVAGGMAKGAAMLQPAMATMLAVVTTDAAVAAGALRRALAFAVADTFNALLVDGCTSTNDTVLVLANGTAGNEPIERPAGPAFHALVDALTGVCDSLAEQMARDAEGATKLATVVVRGARSDAEARLAARNVACSQLVQYSLYGQDPYWGRILSELGASGAFLDPERVDISYDGVVVCRDGVAAEHDAVSVAKSMQGREIVIEAQLHQGGGEARVRFTDLTPAYIEENKGTS